MIKGSGALLAVGLAVSLCLVGCGVQDGANPAGDPIASGSPTQIPDGDETDASPAQIKAAQLEPCPASDPAIPARSDGLPDLTMKCLGEGPNVRLAGVRGKPMVVNVWASWCGPCRAELPMLGDASRSMPSIRFLGIDLADSRSAALEMAGATSMNFPSVMDPNSQIRSTLRIIGVPATLFVSADGVIVGRAALIANEAELKELIAKYLGVTV